ncbi:hypothetical protein BRYFOR_05773 [Marvinbryantia formatexigens DSM 14469]|uniref:Uncharacterized protein n=1 Tax=Marvinbryantia formatexigens DSM 14469 TaxID=478749 RepID=C6LAX9_9FIRM|nr:hypothetical protein BRYFOR_05773 [Marvinbryantia formatexigens DSM 14469]
MNEENRPWQFVTEQPGKGPVGPFLTCRQNRTRHAANSLHRRPAA